MKRTITLPPWAKDRLQRRLETGGAIVALRQRRYTWAQIADSLDLGDDREAQRLATNYLLYSSTRPPQTAQDGREGDPLPDDHPPDAA